MDPFSIDDASEQEKMTALAAALRRREDVGQLFQLTGDKVLSPLGQNLMASADRGEQRLDSTQNRRLQLRLENERAASQEKHQQTMEGFEGKRLGIAEGNAAAERGRPFAAVDANGAPGFYRLDKSGMPVPLNLKPPSKGGVGGPGMDLTPQALDDYATQLHTTGAMPSGLGQGQAATAMRVKIANRAAEMFGGTDLAVTRAGYGANTKSLTKQQSQADAMNAFESTALANLDTFLEQAEKVVDVGSPLFNAPGREFAARVSGDPNMAAFNAARQTAVQEIGKVLSGALGGTAISDSARHEVEGLLGPDSSLAQIRAAAQILKRDMANRKKAVEGQLDETRGRISGKSPPPKDGQADTAVESQSAKKPVKYLVRPDGKVRVPVFADGSKGPEEPNQ